VTESAEAERTKVLVVDDEIGYCDKIARYLAGLGYGVLTSTNGRDAIRLGGVHRPSVLITDWMLCDRVHGLHVIDTIRTVHPDTRAVVMTGYASGDLRLEAKTRDGCEFVEKPFSPDRLARAVEELIAMRAPAPMYPNLAFLRCDSAREVTYLNQAARTLLGCGKDEEAYGSLDALFAAPQSPSLQLATSRWVYGLRPANRPEVPCVARARRLPDGTYFVLVGEEEDAPLLRYHTATHLLLDLVDTLPSLRKVSGHGIVIDTDIGARTLVGCVFEELGSICHSTESFQRGLELLARDPEVRYVVVDPAVAGELNEFVREARAIRPDALLVGHADRKSFPALSCAALDKRITKPWQVSDFVDLLVDPR
jgi:CheY-like chemotaxis protein